MVRKDLILAQSLGMTQGTGQVKGHPGPGFKENIHIRPAGSFQNAHNGGMGLGYIQHIPPAAVDIGAAAADIAVPADAAKTGFHVLKAPSGVEEHQMAVLPGPGDGPGRVFRHRTVDLGGQGSVYIKKGDFSHGIYLLIIA